MRTTAYWLVLVHSCFLLFGRFCGRTCGRRFSEASKPNGTILILSGPKLRRLKFGKTWEAHHCLERCAPALVNFTLSAEAAADFESAATFARNITKTFVNSELARVFVAETSCNLTKHPSAPYTGPIPT